MIIEHVVPEPTGQDQTKPVSATYPLPVALSSTNNGVHDAFNRIRVSQPHNLIDAIHQYDASPLTWGTIVTGAGTITHKPNMSAVELGTGTASGDKIVYQTKRYLRYQPGKSHFLLMSFVLGAGKSNVRRRVGYFDADNGIFLEQTSAGIFWVRRSKASGSVVEERVAQADWNMDKMDGTAPSLSGVTLDMTKVQLAVVDLQWLSAGEVRCGFNVDGMIYYCHQFSHANIISEPYMSTGNLPIRYEMENTGTATASTLLAVCATLSSEGGHNPIGHIRSANTGSVAESVGAAEPILAIRPKLTHKTYVNRGSAQLLGLEIMASADILWELFYNPTLTSASFASVDTESNMEFDTAATGSTGGVRVASGYKASGTGLVQIPIDLQSLFLTLNPAGTTGDILALVLTSPTGNVNTYASMSWREDW